MPQEDTKQPLSDTASSGLTYEKAGVSIAAAEDAVARIKRLAESTRTPQVLAGVGPFAAAFQADFAQYEEPLLVASTDGVGTKVKLAAAFGRYKEVGRDTVAVSTNDVLTCGASPLFFLDYIACNRVEPNVIEELVTGMRDGCLEASMALVGGELAEMRDLYSPGEFDLVGFAVGVVDRSQLITGEQITVGDRLLAVPSSGIHANGLTLARKVFKGMSEEQWKQIDDRLGCSLADEMLKPTRIYAREMKHLLDAGLQIRGAAHISGGGIPGNLSRILPPGVDAQIRGSLLPKLPIFDLIAERGPVATDEMWRTFNMGVGLLLAVRPANVEPAKEVAQEEGFSLLDIGEVVPGDQRVNII